MFALGTDASLNKAAAELGIPLDEARREHVANEQLRMVLVHTRVGTIAATLFALFVFAVLFAISGFFLWLGERDHRFLLEGTGTVHEMLTLVSVGLVSGHLYLALIHPATRHALRGITLGDVREDWAREHHRKWVEEQRGL